MALSIELISQFAKITNDNKTEKKETTVYGTTVEYNGAIYVQLDGSDLLTPISTTTDMQPGERVTVMIKNHTATVTGNISSPAARTDDVKKIGDQISEFEIVIADKVSTSELEAERGRIDNLVSDNVTIKKKLTAAEADIGNLTADNVTINEKLTANQASIEELETKKLDAEIADITYATIGDLKATNANIHNLEADYGDFVNLTTEKFTATDASIKNLETNKLSAESADLKYANIDFSNIGKAAIEQFYAKSGIIADLVLGDGYITGKLVGVTIKGDLIEGNTIVADKLVIKGEDGLYYKLNTNGVTTSAEQTDYNSLNGKIITAKSITAEKVNVDDLVAFDATIGGFNITENALYSGVKESVDNTTRGVYLDNTGQVAFGDESNFLKYYRDTDGTYKLEISAGTIRMSSSNKTVEEVVGKAIVKTEEQFYQSTSPTSLTGGSWSTSQPTWTDGTYIWRRTLVTYGDGTTSYTPSQNGVCITGNTGAKGDKGDTGSTGKGISKTEVFYYLSTSNTTQTGGSWSTTVPAWADGCYYWQKIKTTYTDDTTSESTPVCITGAKGETGSSGSTGATGTGVESITTEFYLSTSKTTQTGGSWTSTMPTWSSGKYLWTRNKIVYKNPTSTVYTTPICDSSWEAVNEIEIGGRNLLRNTKNFEGDNIGGSSTISTDLYKDLVVRTYDNSSATIGYEDIITFADIYPEQLGETYTLSFYAKGSGENKLETFFHGATGYLPVSKVVQSNGTMNQNSDGKSTWTLTNDWKRYWVTWTLAGSGDITVEKHVLFRLYYGGTASVCGVKLEKGNKATDWTPAPEDVNQKIDDTSTEIHKTITEQNTEIIKNCEKMILKAVENYTETGDFEEFKSTIETQLSIMAGEIDMNFTTITKEIVDVDGELQEKFTEVYKYIRFVDGDIVLGSSENAITLTIENDRISFKKNEVEFGWWDGVDFHTGNIVVELNERAQFGNFAFIPRSDGSLSFLKVGG